jgi:putative ABC transport system permease protein
MKLALRELRRRPGRFLVATLILTLIAMLLMFLGGLLDGLLAGSTGALRAQRADLIVYSSTARNSLVRSRITPATQAQVAAVPGTGSVGGLGSVQLGARIPGRGPRDLVPVVLFGYETAPRGLPATPPPTGQVYADDTLKASGVHTGTVISLGPERTPVTVVGFISDTRYLGQSTLWGSLTTWRDTQSANRPGERTGPGVVQALVVRVEGPQPATPSSIDAATGGATTTLTINQAINALPGLSQQQTVFNQIIGVTVVIAIVVVALFFALITIERMPLYGVLKALGAGSGTLFAGVLVQAFIVTLIAATVAALAAVALAAAIPPGSIPFVATPLRLVSSTAYLLIAAAVGCAFSLRRVLRIDPATAIGGGS